MAGIFAAEKIFPFFFNHIFQQQSPQLRNRTFLITDTEKAVKQAVTASRKAAEKATVKTQKAAAKAVAETKRAAEDVAGSVGSEFNENDKGQGHPARPRLRAQKIIGSRTLACWMAVQFRFPAVVVTCSLGTRVKSSSAWLIP